MKYAHLADLHLGSWREPKMREISTKVFLKAIDDCIEKQVDFILFAGDLFNTSMPDIDTLKLVTKKLKELEQKNIPLYAIAGSHDFSPSGKTMLDVLENAGLLTNVCKGSVNQDSKLLELKFTIDQKTKAKITGIIGRRGMLDRTYYENLSREPLEQELGYKIFMFHTTLTELKPKHLEMLDSQPASFLPKGLNYYAGGHIHHKTLINIPQYGPLTYTGSLFPNNFSEFEKYSFGGYYIIDVDTNNQNNQTIEWVPCQVIDHQKLILKCDHKTPEEIQNNILEHFESQDLNNTIVTIRLIGKLSQGKTSDINFSQIYKKLHSQGTYLILKNTSKLQSVEFEQIKMSSNTTTTEELEEGIIKEHLGQSNTLKPEVEMQLSKSLLKVLNQSKAEGEKVYDFQDRMKKEIDVLLSNN